MKFKEQLKNAICKNDIDFLRKNRDKYSINDRFEDENNDTLLLYSISDKESSVYNYLLENDADYKLKNDEKENILHAIVYSGDEKRLIDFLDNYKIDLDERTIDGATPLLLAVSLEHIEIAKILIKVGSNVNIGDENGITPLHLAAQLNYLDLLKELVENGANLRLKTIIGNYPLALAINADKDENVKYLYSKIYGGVIM